mmetsp:Transcript_12353/g.33868  ORF Transcript_12353/g.33868 Transcript_12353/m.33868 type:complete len:249 (+) Transcript_12353:5416-6162(+)
MLQGRGGLNLCFRSTLRSLLHALLPISNGRCREVLVLLLLASLHAGDCLLLVHCLLLGGTDNHELLLDVPIPWDSPARLGGLHARHLVARPDLGSTDLVPEPPAAEGGTITLVPIVQEDVNVLMAWNLLRLLVVLPAMVDPTLTVLADKRSDANLIPLCCGVDDDRCIRDVSLQLLRRRADDLWADRALHTCRCNLGCLCGAKVPLPILRTCHSRRHSSSLAAPRHRWPAPARVLRGGYGLMDGERAA